MNQAMVNQNYLNLGNEKRGKIATRFRELCDSGLQASESAIKACREFDIPFNIPTSTLFGWSYVHSNPKYKRRRRMRDSIQIGIVRPSALKIQEEAEKKKATVSERGSTVIGMIGALSSAIDDLSERIQFLESELGVRRTS
jgi:hypothetical protein